MINPILSSMPTVSGNEKTDELQTLFDVVKTHQPTIRVDDGRKPFANDDRIQAIYFDGEKYEGRETEIFAYIGFPEDASPERAVPAMVLVHGGMGHAYAEWVQYWVNEGYAAISVDGFGQQPPQGAYREPPEYWKLNPNSHPTIDEFRSADKPLTQQWFYQYICDVILGNNILRGDARVQKEHIGITGISWGSVATSVVIGYDNRFAFAVPVYGGGFLDKSTSSFVEFVNREGVPDVWDPSLLMGRVEIPVLFVNGDNDPFFSADINTNSAAAVQNGSVLYIPGLEHGQQPGSVQPEIVRFANEQNGRGEGNIKIHDLSFDGSFAEMTLSIPKDVHSVKVYAYSRTTPLEYNGKELIGKWNRTLGKVQGTKARVRIPKDMEMVYISVQGKSGKLFSSKAARASTGLLTREMLKDEACNLQTPNL